MGEESRADERRRYGERRAEKREAQTEEIKRWRSIVKKQKDREM